ncbi:MAG: hypothetical protein J6K52_01855 [Clostridia bacterium]|nr:hypothetical protein [Clostridia bacterium]
MTTMILSIVSLILFSICLIVSVIDFYLNRRSGKNLYYARTYFLKQDYSDSIFGGDLLLSGKFENGEVIWLETPMTSGLYRVVNSFYDEGDDYTRVRLEALICDEKD